MPIKDKDRKARANYRKKIEALRVELFPTDADIKSKLAERLESGEGKATYVKRLIREDIERSETKMTDIEILMADNCTRSEAEKHLKNGTVVLRDFETNFDSYMKEWDIDEEDIPLYKTIIERKEPIPDWGIVSKDGKTFYIEYCL